MKVAMHRMSHEVVIEGLEPETNVIMEFSKSDTLVDSADEEGKVYFQCGKLIPRYIRKEVLVKIGNMEHVYEVRQTKLVPKRIIEVRKESA